MKKEAGEAGEDGTKMLNLLITNPDLLLVH